MCFDFLYNVCLKHFSFLEEVSEIRVCTKMCVGLHVKYPLFLSGFNESFSSTDFQKILKCQISWTFIQWERSCSIWADRRTEIMKLIGASHKFVKAPKVYILKPVSRGTWAQRTPVCCGKVSFYLAVCLTTGPKPLPKRAPHILRSRASSFKWEYILLSLSSSSSFLLLLPRLPVTAILRFIFPLITRLQSRKYGVLKIQTSSTPIKLNLLAND
jgi:hypothetical protein